MNRTHARLAANAYRVLGLPADASQAAIDAAARKMRIWPDASKIPPTAWDVLSLGPVNREKLEIEQAVVRLAEPGSRLQERIFWFAARAEALAGKGADGLSGAIEKLAESAHPAARHDMALASFAATLSVDPEISDAESWRMVLESLADVARSDDYLAWLLEVEGAGEFEKGASAEETAQATAMLPGAAVAVMSSKADELLTAGRLYDCSRIVEVMRACGDVSPEAKRVASRVLDHMEDTLEARCQEMAERLRGKVVIDEANFELHRVNNLRACQEAAGYFDQMIEPVLAELESVSREDRYMRIRMAAAQVLEMIAIGWIWSDRVSEARLTFGKALTQARGTPLEAEMAEKQQRLTQSVNRHVRENLARSRAIRDRQLTQAARQGSGEGLNWRWIWVAVIAGGALLRACSAIVGTSATRSRSSPPRPTPTPQVAQEEAPHPPAHKIATPPQATAKEGGQQALLKELTQSQSGKK